MDFFSIFLGLGFIFLIYYIIVSNCSTMTKIFNYLIFIAENYGSQ